MAPTGKTASRVAMKRPGKEAKVGATKKAKLAEATEEAPEEVCADGEVNVSTEVNAGRVRLLKQAIQQATQGAPVVYWMSRDQHSHDNWALLYAAQQAHQQRYPLCVSFNLVQSFLHAQARHFFFMLHGLRVVQQNLSSIRIPFFLLRGKVEDNIPAFVERCGASILVMDFSPLRIGRAWREAVCRGVPSSVSVFDVDAHNGGGGQLEGFLGFLFHFLDFVPWRTSRRRTTTPAYQVLILKCISNPYSTIDLLEGGTLQPDSEDFKLTSKSALRTAQAAKFLFQL
ncbi:hypothetical protein GOP47_0013221 [Adiantum capillus-veneris]|uniref:Photolyase/cryptochrome alpha/beta domain-containing protein n=1 Tax=Adiantum capillus-veneris TaxID=13818 RepID=A0A9D4UNB7_ADICA|nr:hypothetical protein GOP47_0013221 [Adiantum capillus-veneris]